MKKFVLHDVRFLLAKNEWNIRSDVTIKKKPITIKAVIIVSASSTPFIYISISYFKVTFESFRINGKFYYGYSAYQL